MNSTNSTKIVENPVTAVRLKVAFNALLMIYGMLSFLPLFSAKYSRTRSKTTTVSFIE